MFDPAKVGEEIFKTLRSFNYEVAVFDADGNKTYEPTDGRRFFTPKNVITVSLYEDGENSALHIYLSRQVALEKVQGLLNTLRKCATKFGILYNVRKYRREIGPKDFANGNATVFESRKLTGSTKSSYLKLEGARMIVRHDNAIDDSKQGARGRNVRKVFIENAEGERFLMPTQNMMAGRAMTRHVSEGGHFHDDTGQKLTELAAQQQHMKTCASYCRKNKKKLDEGVMQLVEVCTVRAKHLRNVFEAVYRNYAKGLKEMEKENDNILLEDDLMEEKVEALKAKLQLEDDSVVDRPTCESIVKVLGESDLLEGRPAKVPMFPLPALGCEVEHHAWNAFKQEPPVVNFINNTAPNVTPAGNNLSAGLSLVAMACKDDAFSNMLSKVAQWLEDGKSDALLKHIAHRAIRAASEHSNVGEAKPLVKTPSKDKRHEIAESRKDDVRDGIIVNESINSFQNWMDSLSEEAIFEDDWGTRYPQAYNDDNYGPALEAALDAVQKDFNVDDFLVMNGSDFHYGDDSLSAEDKVIGASDLMSSLDTYLNGEIENEINDEGSNDDFGDISDICKAVLPQVVSRLETEGYSITGMDEMESDDAGLALDASDSVSFDDRMMEAFHAQKEVDGEWVPVEGSECGDHQECRKFVHRHRDGDHNAKYKIVPGKLALSEEELEEYRFTSKGNKTNMPAQGNRQYSGSSPSITSKTYGGKPKAKGHGEFMGGERDRKTTNNMTKLNTKYDDEKKETVGDDGLDDDKALLLSGENDLSAEDVLQPVNPQNDFSKEVAADSDKEADEDNTAYINRLKGLAGIKAQAAPKAIQP